MKKLAILGLLFLGSCKVLEQPPFDASGNPVVISDQPVTIPIGDQGDTITIQPGSTEPRPATLGDSLTAIGAQVIGGATGQPWLVPVIGGLAGLFLRKKKQVA